MNCDQGQHRRALLRQARSEAKLVPIGWALAGMLTLALLIAGGVAGILLLVVPFRPVRPEALSTAALYDLLKIAFAFAAGVGGVVALVAAYRRQRVAEFAQDLADQTEQRIRSTEQDQRELASRAEAREDTRLFNERFATAAGQLGGESPAVRLAGVYAMAGLADDWADQRQTCVDVLCAYLRMPYQPVPAEDAPAAERQMFGALREVRHTVIRVITAHLQPEVRRAKTLQDWRGLDFDFTGAVFDGGNFGGAEFSGGTVGFDGAEFSGGTVGFDDAEFSGGTVNFDGAEFSGGTVNFDGAEFSGGTVRFGSAKFSGARVWFSSAKFSGANVWFGAEFSDGTVSFGSAKFSGATVVFGGAKFSGSTVDFNGADFSGADFNGTVVLGGAEGGYVAFRLAESSVGAVFFGGADFNGSTVDFGGADFNGSAVAFGGAKFSAGTVDFRNVKWAVPPVELDQASIPPGIVLNLPGQ